MSVNSYIDHTLLKADANKEQILSLIDEAKKYEFASVCVNPTWVKTASELLKDSSVKVCTVMGFPLGASTSAVKAFEAKDAIANGADEIDMDLKEISRYLQRMLNRKLRCVIICRI